MDTSKTGRIIGFAAFIAVLILSVFLLRPVILPFLFAVIFAYLLQPAVTCIENTDVGPGASIIIVYVFFYTLLAAVISLCVPIMVSQFNSLFVLLPNLLQKATHAVAYSLAGVDSYVLRDLLEALSGWAVDAFSNKAVSLIDDTAAILSRTLQIVFYAVLTPFLSYYFLRDKDALRNRITAWLPVHSRTDLLRLAGDVDHLFRQYALGYLLVSLAVAFLSTLFYWSIGMDYAMALGAFMGMADLIPYFGPFIGAIPSVAIALSTDAGLAILTVIGLIIIQQIESFVITPRIIGDRVGIHPLTTIFAVLAGGWLFGVLGAVLAVPVTAAGLLIIRYLWSSFVGVKME